MARYVDPVCKLCRREGAKLFLKGERCQTEKCSFDRRSYVPGQHGQRMRRTRSDYERQLRMKQKAKRAYGVLEGQFRTYYQRAAHKEGVTGDLLMQQLEMRLDNVVYRLGLAPSRSAARQLVRHRHIDVNDRIVNVPSYQLRKGDTVKVRQKSRELERIHLSLQRAIRGRDVPWLEIDKVGLAGHVLDVPAREVIPTPVEEQLIIELYSK